MAGGSQAGIDAIEGPSRWMPIVVEEIAKGASISRAARIAGISPVHAYKYKAKHPEFAKAVEAAMQIGTDAVRDEIWRRAVEGIEEPVFSAQLGRQIGTTTKYDSTLLIFEAKRRDPAYRDNFKVEHTGSIAHNVNLQLESLQDLLSGAQPTQVPASNRREAAKALLAADDATDADVVHDDEEILDDEELLDEGPE